MKELVYLVIIILVTVGLACGLMRGLLTLVKWIF